MTQYYIDGISVTRLEKIADKVDERIAGGEDEFVLKNGRTVLVYSDGNRYMIHDEELNLIEETQSRYELAFTMIQLSRF